MRFARGTLLVVAAMFLPLDEAGACECFHDQLDLEAAQTAASIFEFRPVELRAESSDPPDGGLVTGKIEVTRVLKGDARGFSSVEFHIGTCCGIRLVPGLHYVAFTSSSGPALGATKGNILAVPPIARSFGWKPNLDEMFAEIRRDPYLIEFTQCTLDIVHGGYCRPILLNRNLEREDVGYVKRSIWRLLRATFAVILSVEHKPDVKTD